MKNGNVKLYLGGIIVLAAGIGIGLSFNSSDSQIQTYSAVGQPLQIAVAPSVINSPPPADDPKALALAGDHSLETGDYLKAIMFYEKALALDPKDADTWNDLGLARHYTKQSKKGVEAIRKAVAIEPKFQRAWLSLGFILRSLGKFDESNAALKRAMDIDPKNQVGREALSMIASNAEQAKKK